MCKRARAKKEEEAGRLCLSGERRRCDWRAGSTGSEGGCKCRQDSVRVGSRRPWSGAERGFYFACYGEVTEEFEAEEWQVIFVLRKDKYSFELESNLELKVCCNLSGNR